MLAFKILWVFFIQVSPKREKKPLILQYNGQFLKWVCLCAAVSCQPPTNTHLTAELNWSSEERNGGKGSPLADWHHPSVPLTASSCVLIHKAPLKWRFQPCCSVLYSRQFTGEENLPRSKQRTGSPPSLYAVQKNRRETCISQWKIKFPVRMPSPLVWLLP